MGHAASQKQNLVLFACKLCIQKRKNTFSKRFSFSCFHCEQKSEPDSVHALHGFVLIYSGKYCSFYYWVIAFTEFVCKNTFFINTFLKKIYLSINETKNKNVTPQLTSVWLSAIKHGWSGDRPDAPLCHQNKQSLQCQVRERDCPEILPRIETITDMHDVQTLGCYVCLQTLCWSLCGIKLASAGVRFWSARKIG